MLDRVAACIFNFMKNAHAYHMTYNCKYVVAQMWAIACTAVTFPVFIDQTGLRARSRNFSPTGVVLEYSKQATDEPVFLQRLSFAIRTNKDSIKELK
jgi:hypothetical protein